MRNRLPTIIDILGVSTVCIGAGMIYLPAAIVLAGMALILAADKLRRLTE